MMEAVSLKFCVVRFRLSNFPLDFTLINDGTNAQWDNKTGRIFGYDQTLSSQEYCLPPLNSHWIKPRFVPNRYSLRFDPICNGKTNAHEKISDLDLELEVIQNSNKVVQGNPKLVIEEGNIDIVTTHLNSGEYTYDLKASSKTASTSGHIEIAFNYKVERTLLMMISNIVVYSLMVVIVLDSLIHNEYKILRYFIFSLQFIHFTGLIEVKSPPSAIFFVNSVSLTSFTNVWMTRLMMGKPIETDSTSFYNGGLETRHTIWIVPFTILLIGFIFLCLLLIFYILKWKVINFGNEQKRLRVMSQIKKTYVKRIAEFCAEMLFPYYLLIPIYEIYTFRSGTSGVDILSLLVALVVLGVN